jgi:hypothetical protein
MVDVDEAAPADIVDRLLWRDAQHMLGRHVAAGNDGTCVWCGWRWPCSARRLAERADTVARRPWREAWTLRHDLNSMRALPGKRAGVDEIGTRYTGAGPHHRNDDHRRYQA